MTKDDWVLSQTMVNCPIRGESSMRLQGQRQIAWLLILISVGLGSSASAENEPKDTNVIDKIGSTAKKAGDKIEQGVSNAAKKIEEKHIGDKIEQKLKKAASKTAEGFEKAEKKIEQKLR